MTTFSYDGSVIQYDTITATGVYDIVAAGAQGGGNLDKGYEGGLAASSGGYVLLRAGAVLEIVVGGAGSDATNYGGGGGGGSYVIEINNGSSAVDINEVIAGGGGGAARSGAGGSGLAGPTGGGGGGASGAGGAGGVNGAGGAGGVNGGGGGGFEGGAGAALFSTGSSGVGGGSDFAGGSGTGVGAQGGFGGGGGGSFAGGGGGGGFGGGGGGGGLDGNSASGSGSGGGGGSYVNPSAGEVTKSAGVHSGNGQVSITPVAGARIFNDDGSVIQYDTITATGVYDIVAAGAQGGGNLDKGYEGGLAASSGGYVLLRAGAVLEIVVGGAGSDATNYGGGGGGGSYVIEINNGSSAVDINEVIAGGGGGAARSGAGGSGLAGPTGGDGGGASGAGGAGGINGAGGAGGVNGGGGGGFEGGAGAALFSTGSSGVGGGSDFAGGSGTGVGAQGGFGGGGGGSFAGGGGGGGFGGGGGGGGLDGNSASGSGSGGGGGSYVNPSAAAATKSAGVNSGNGFVTITPVCYCRGTRIQTARGEIAVEDLVVGDLVVTASGGARPIEWIGRRVIDLTRHVDPARARPIRIAAGAFPGGVPHRDLLVSPGHAVVFDGMLIPVKLLSNGASIAADAVCREVTYFHVELASHDILLAEGLAAESYLDTGNRDMFENAGPALVLHPDFSTGQQARVSGSCLPFADRADQVEPVWRALVERARALGWAVPLPVVTDDPDLHVRVGTRRIDPVAVGGGCYTFVLPPGGAQVTLASRAGRPSDARPWIADDRLLGAMVRRLVHRNGDTMWDVAMDDPALQQGWWVVESDAGWPCRWTTGDAILPVLGAGVLEVQLSRAMLYPAAHAARAAGAWPKLGRVA